MESRRKGSLRCGSKKLKTKSGGRKGDTLKIEDDNASSGQNSTCRYRQKSELEKTVVQQATERGTKAMMEMKVAMSISSVKSAVVDIVNTV